jgi:TonB-dependent starch-binding outer membrane protein SusC
MKWLNKMKLKSMRVYFLLVMTILTMDVSYAIPKFNLGNDFQDESLVDVLKEMSEKYQVFFTYDAGLLKDVKVNFEFREKEPIQVSLKRLLNETGFQFKSISEKYLVIYKDDKSGRKAAKKVEKKIKELEEIERNSQISVQRNTSDPFSTMKTTLKGIQEIKNENTIVRGIVLNNNKEPLIGVSVLIAGTNLGTATDINGRFSLSMPEGRDTLIFSYLGYEKQEYALNGNTELIITLAESTVQLSEVTVVSTGFQNISKERITGSHGSLNEEVISQRPTANIAEALNGQIAGLVSDPTTGFIIRGRGTLSNTIGDRSPLIVVDGFPIEGGFQTINPNDIKSVDVLKDAAASSIYGARASNGVIVITTKKPVNGKINVQYNSFYRTSDYLDLDHYMNMIDTKTQMNLEENLFNSLKSTTFVRNPYLSTTPRGLINEHFTLYFDRLAGKISEEQVTAGRAALLQQDYRDDYYKYILRKPFSQQQNLMLSGSTDRNSFKFSILYDNDKTHLQRNNDNKYMLGFNNKYLISKSVSYNFSTNITFRNQALNGVNLGNARSSTSPWTRIYDNNGGFARHASSYYDPMIRTLETVLPYSMRYNFYEESLLRNNLTKSTDIRIQNDFEIKIAEGFNIRPMFQYERFNDEDRSIYSPESFSVRQMANLLSTLDTISKKYVAQIPVGGVYRLNGKNERTSYKGRLQADYNKVFKDKHEIAIVGGGEIISGKTNVDAQDLKLGYNPEGLNHSLFDFNVQRNTIWNENAFNAGMTYEGTTFNPYNFSRQANVLNERYISGYFSGSYTFSSKYTASVSARTDASNYISRTNAERFSPFYSLGLRWNLKNESFFRQNENVDRLALRVTYGATGNAAGKTAVLPFSVFSNVAPNAETGNLPRGSVNGRVNDALTWEKTYSTNLGVDFSMFNRKIFGSVDLYNRLSKDLIAQVQTSNTVWSVASLNINSGKVLNRGVELNLGTDQRIAGKVNWTSNLVFDFNYNKVLEYNFRTTRILDYVGNTFFVQGHPTDRVMAIKVAGTTPEGFAVQEKRNGEFVVLNNSNNSLAGFGTLGNTTAGIKVADDDRMWYMGRSTPPATLGFTNSFSWKGFTLMGVITGRMGHIVRRSDYNMFYNAGALRYSATGFSQQLPTLTAASTDAGITAPTPSNFSTYSLGNDMFIFYSDKSLQKASSIRFDDLYLEYALPSNITGLKKVVTDISLFVQGRNLGLLWTNNEDGIDPQNLPGTIRPFKTVTFGSRIKF